MNMLGGKLNLAIDTDLKVLVDDGGKLHESAALSEGYKDMAQEKQVLYFACHKSREV